ncbi:hypothetical protein OCOL_000027 [Ordospora colligata]|uniref:Translation initiation factor eIF2B subunit gamma n=1 Tax=Ordospora colligata OC4 TaxID=1354746 RepID=A0A0B2ULF6_9MICR|nr:putative nucleotidyl transferase [Ordospora colligata OC4]KHN69790.1 putative nucleotidyl transferase [Ordospora colligata OC4]TBU15593.1 putative nucleotidyl transferase [Ordospora colligata]TBU15660.1 putative nucleotidyl transferase [Ordospora colligata]
MFETIILIGPGAEMFPIVNKRLPKACIPIVNRPIIHHAIKLLESVTRKFIIIGLNEERDAVLDATRSTTKKPIKYIGIEMYDGTVASLMAIRSIIECEDVIVCKGDIVGSIDIKEMVQKYFESKRMLMVTLQNSKMESTLMGYRAGNLMFYGNSQDYKISFGLLKDGLTLTKDYDVVPLYMMKSSLFEMLDSRFFSFKHDLMPNLVKELGVSNPVGIYSPRSGNVYHIRTIDDYLEVNALLKKQIVGASAKPKTDDVNAKFVKEYAKKNSIKDISNLIDTDVVIEENAFIFGSIIGSKCIVGNESKVMCSILMDGVKIGKKSHIEGTLIGSMVSIPEGSKLVNCKVSPGYVFSNSVCSSDGVFGL